MSKDGSFEMPRANPGMQILWYKRGFYDRTSREVAYMLHCGENTAVIISCTGRRADAIRHIDDPKLQLNPDQRENGAWDFTDDHKEMMAFKRDMLERIGQLEQKLAALESSGAPKRHTRQLSEEKKAAAGERIRKYHALANQAKAMGIEVKRSTKLPELIELIEAKQRDALVS